MITTLVVLLAGLLPLYVVRFPLFGIPTNVFEVMVWLVFISTICFSGTRRKIIDVAKSLPFATRLGAILFIVAALISTVYSPILSSSLGILKGWIVTPMVFGLIVLLTKHSDPQGHQKIIRSLVYSGLVVSLLGLSQVNGAMRIHAIYDVPNSLSLFLVPICVIAFWVGMQTKNRLYIGGALFMLAAIVGTQSFGAVIALAGTGMLGVLLGKLRLSAMEHGVIVVLGLIIVFIFFLSGRVGYIASPLWHIDITTSATVRLQLWDVGIRLIQKHPIVGIGLGQFEAAYQRELHGLFADPGQQSTFYKLAPEFVFRDPHNWIISFWLNLGVLGGASFLFLAIATLSAGIKSFSLDSEKHAYIQAATLAIISMLIFGLVDTIYWKNDLSALWWMLLLLIADRNITPIYLKA